MAKKAKAEKRTITGKVRAISVTRVFDGESVVNVDVEIPSPDARVFIDIALWGQEALGLLYGKRLNDDASAWVRFQPPIKVGARVCVTGKYSVKSWKPTRSKTLGKVVKKGYIPVYDPAQLRVLTLPKL